VARPKQTESKGSPCFQNGSCAHLRDCVGSAHKRCNCFEAKVIASAWGVSQNWCNWPLNFDPIWIEECDSFSDDDEHRAAPVRKADPLAEILGMFASVGRRLG